MFLLILFSKKYVGLENIYTIWSKTTEHNTFWIKNLNDASYVVNMIPFGPGFGQLTLDFYGHPRTIGMDLYYKF